MKLLRAVGIASLLSVIVITNLAHAQTWVADKTVLSKNSRPRLSLEQLYNKGMLFLNQKQYDKAIKYFTVCSQRAINSDYQIPATINIIYTKYLQKKFEEAQVDVNLLIKKLENKGQMKYMDYLLFLRGYMALRQHGNDFVRYVFGNKADQVDYVQLTNALKDFSTIVNAFPKSYYAPHAKALSLHIRNKILAQQELAIAKFYSKKGAHVAVINRVANLIRNFSDSVETRKALPYMEKAYRSLGREKEANTVRQIIIMNTGRQMKLQK